LDAFPRRFDLRKHKQYDLAYQRRLASSTKLSQRELDLRDRERLFEDERAKWERER
jgi:hypothetical protein